MKGPYSGEPGIDWHISKEPLSFYGIPSECRGQLSLINKSDAKVKIRHLATQNAGEATTNSTNKSTSKSTSKKTKKNAGLNASQINLFARIKPNSETCVTAELEVPHNTAPGQYQTTVVYGKQKHPVDVTILEHHELIISPSHIRAKGESGDKVSCEISISNMGNVALELGDVGMVWLREQNWVGRTLVYTLRETTAEDSFEEFENHLLQNFRKDIIPAARIQFEPAKISSIAAGDTLTRNATLTLPSGLMKGRRYLGFIKINEHRIWLEVYCSGGQKQKIQ